MHSRPEEIPQNNNYYNHLFLFLIVSLHLVVITYQIYNVH